MKQFRFWHRIILVIGSLAMILTGLALIVPVLADKLGLNMADIVAWPFTKFISLGVGAVLIIFALYLFTLPHKFTIRRKDFVIRQTENGELRIAVNAIKNLVKKCVDAHEEVTLSSIRIHNVRDGVTVDLSISLANNIIIPLVVASLQKKVKQYLQTSSGIEVKEVRVSVETAKDAANSSPYIVKEDAAEAEAPAKEKKQPIHQRLFKRDEAQPAPLPEAPETVEAAAEAAVETVEETAETVETAEEAPVSAPAVQEEESAPAEEAAAESEEIQTPIQEEENNE